MAYHARHRLADELGEDAAKAERDYRSVARVRVLQKKNSSRLESLGVVAKLNQMGYDVEGIIPEQHAAKIKEDLVKWAAVVKATGLPKQ